MDSCDSSEELFSDVDGGTDDHPLTYEQYCAIQQKGAKPPHNGYVLRTSSGESEPEGGEEDEDLVSKRHDITLKLINRAKNNARIVKSKAKGKGKKKPSATPRKLYVYLYFCST